LYPAGWAFTAMAAIGRAYHRRRVSTRFAPGRCSYKSTALLPTVGAPAADAIHARPLSHRGGAPTQKQPLPRIVGAPAPGAIHARPVRTGAVLLHKNRPSLGL